MIKMQKGIKNINITLVWLIGLMLFSHAVIPHHHHFDSVFDHSHQNEQSDSNSKQCHAFNYLLVDEARIITVDNSTYDNHLFAIFNNESDSWFTDANPKSVICQKLHISVVEFYFDNTPTRGSPIHV